MRRTHRKHYQYLKSENTKREKQTRKTSINVRREETRGVLAPQLTAALVSLRGIAAAQREAIQRYAPGATITLLAPVCGKRQSDPYLQRPWIQC